MYICEVKRDTVKQKRERAQTGGGSEAYRVEGKTRRGGGIPERQAHRNIWQRA